MDFIPARYSILASDALEAFVAKCYPLSADMTCVYWQEAQSGGNDMYLITSEAQRYILRVYLNEASSYSEIDAQAHLCNDLADGGISAPRVMPAKDVQFVQSLKAAEGIRYVTLTELVAELGAKLKNLPKSAPTFGVCHGDPHKSNALCSDQTLTLMDFDCAGYSWRAYDLAVFRWSTGRPQRFGGLEADRAQAIWQAFLDGYQSRYPLPDRDLIRDFVLVRHIWWLAIDFKKVRLGKSGRSWIDDGLFDFQLGILRELREIVA